MDNQNISKSLPKTFGFYHNPVIKQVPPLRATILNDFQKDIRDGKFSRRDAPRFKEFIEKGWKRKDILSEIKIDKDDFDCHRKNF